MTKTISIEMDDATAHAIIRTALDGPYVRVWCKSATPSSWHLYRYTLTITAEAAEERDPDATEASPAERVLDVFPGAVREAIAQLLAADQPRGHREIAVKAILDGGGIDSYQADAILQQAVLGRVVYG